MSVHVTRASCADETGREKIRRGLSEKSDRSKQAKAFNWEKNTVNLFCHTKVSQGDKIYGETKKKGQHFQFVLTINAKLVS